MGVKISTMGQINFQIKVELTWAQNYKFVSKSSWRLVTNSLNVGYRIQVAQNRIIFQID